MELYVERVKNRVKKLGSVLCVGLDTNTAKLPDVLKNEENPQLVFNKKIIEATQDLSCCYKINMAFYLIHGAKGVEVLGETIQCAHSFDIPVILDAKMGDIGNTADLYAKAAFETLEADAVTVNPYMGEEAIAPFREYGDRGVYILCYTSNLSRIDIQTQLVSVPDREDVPLYQIVAHKVRGWNKKGNLGVVVGATAPEELSLVREIVGPQMPILCPGVGIQGGDLEEVLWAGDAFGGTMVVNVSRAVINASRGEDFAEMARQEAKMFVDQMTHHFSRSHVE